MDEWLIKVRYETLGHGAALDEHIVVVPDVNIKMNDRWLSVMDAYGSLTQYRVDTVLFISRKPLVSSDG